MKEEAAGTDGSGICGHCTDEDPERRAPFHPVYGFPFHPECEIAWFESLPFVFKGRPGA